MQDQELFPVESPPLPGGVRAPETLNPVQTRALEVWAEDRVPWISRGALESLTPLDDYCDACLSHFTGKKTMRPNWLGTIKNWIRRDERQRLERMAKRGNESARLALRDPKTWRKNYDRIERIGTVKTPAVLLSPKDPAKVGPSISLVRRSRA